MSLPPEPVTVECPKCGHVYEDWYRRSINFGLEPELADDDDYLERASTATCPKCETKVRFGMLIADAKTGTFGIRD